MSSEDTYLDAAIRPLQGILAPLFDAYRKKRVKTSPLTIPAWAVSDMRNTPVPYTVEHQYDFGFGGVYGPPDMQVKPGIVNTEQTIETQYVSNGLNPYHRKDTQTHNDQGFSKEQPNNIELFVYSPFVLPSDLPCSTNMLKY